MNSSLKNKCRESNIELYRIVAILLIVISHCLPKYGTSGDLFYINVDASSLMVNDICVSFFNYFGAIGNCMFIICSAWFLVDSGKIKIKKVVSIWVDVLFFSVLFLAIHLLLGFWFPLEDIVKCFLPVGGGDNWFVGTYIILYLIHPAINTVINSLTQKQHLLTVFVMLITYCGLVLFFGNTYSYNSLLGFVTVYILIGYLKKYGKRYSRKESIVRFVGCFFALLILFLATNYIGIVFSPLSNQLYRWATFNNPIIIAMCYFLFQYFRSFNFSSVRINKIASTSLLVYVVSENKCLRIYLKPVFWEWYYDQFTFSGIVGGVLVVSAIVFLLSVAIALVYETTIDRCVLSRLKERMTHCLIYVGDKIYALVGMNG